ncbi:MAG: TFIIB-type zinc ribbon-containing protein [Candidatus Schekmanbacteria bacterium]|nr:MAG: TFIIB-type zinc ribbon-containing protein [Candidatus Schekmanbacteria bacterium]
MTLHIHYTYQCPNCDAYYIPYSKDILCPKCGSKSEEIFDYITEALNSMHFNLEAYGKFTPPAWYVGSLGDHILSLLFPIFDHYENHPNGKSFELVSKNILESMNWADQLYLLPHVHQIALEIYGKLQANKSPE